MINRYSNKELEFIWSDRNKYSVWLQVELLVCEALKEQMIIPFDDFVNIRDNARIDTEKICQIENITKHDVAAFVQAVSEEIGESGRWFHYGLTSSDVVDTANAVLFKQANSIISKDMLNLIRILNNLALKYKHTICVGRTHGVHAEITTFGFKIAVWFDEMQRNYKRFSDCAKLIEVGKISGAVGTFSYFPMDVQEYVCNKLGIGSAKISTQIIQRDTYAGYFSALALIATTIEKFAMNLWQLQTTEINEVQEKFSDFQKGSSAMPHKKNPIKCENLCGCARVMRGYMSSAFENVALWQERDISHSSVERIISPDATILLDYMITGISNILSSLDIKTDVMQENISKSHGVVFSQNLMLKLIANGANRDMAHRLVQKCAEESLEKKVELVDYVLQSKQICDYLSVKQINECFDTEYILRNIEQVFQNLGIS